MSDLFLFGVVAWCLWGGAATSILIRRYLRARGGPQKAWKDAFDVGANFALAHLSRLPEELQKLGPTHHVHDVEVLARRIRKEVLDKISGV